MKVLHIIPSLSPSRGGASAAAIGMCKALAQSGIDVDIATTDDDGEFELDTFITHIMPLDQINEAFDLMHEGKSIRSVVHF